MPKQLTFGEWVGQSISGNAGAKLIRGDAGHFEVEGLVHIAKSIDQTVFMAQLEGRKLTPLESFAMEVLFALASWKDINEATASYQSYLKNTHEED